MRVGSRFDDFWWLHDEVLTDTRGGDEFTVFAFENIDRFTFNF